MIIAFHQSYTTNIMCMHGCVGFCNTSILSKQHLRTKLILFSRDLWWSGDLRVTLTLFLRNLRCLHLLISFQQFFGLIHFCSAIELGSCPGRPGPAAAPPAAAQAPRARRRRCRRASPNGLGDTLWIRSGVWNETSASSVQRREASDSRNIFMHFSVLRTRHKNTTGVKNCNVLKICE